MPTEKQIAANRANASKSSGPKTAAGKERSSRNGIRHGLLARSVVLEGESVKRFLSHLESLRDHFQPSNAIEASLVDNMAVARWRQMRLWALENARLNCEASKHPAENAPTRVALAFQALSDGSRTLEIISRYETACDRQYSRALNNLLKLRQNGNFSKRTQFLESQKTPEP